MTIRLTPDQEAIVERAVATGLAPSAEAFVSMALSHMQDELNFDLEARLGMDIDQLNAEIDKGLATPSRAWEGAASFHSRMLKNQQDIASGRSQE
jgi:hypothetical protein